MKDRHKSVNECVLMIISDYAFSLFLKIEFFKVRIEHLSLETWRSILDLFFKLRKI